ncbi:hypothetical protein VFC49_03480 [Thermococcus sp. SY098]|uniref:cell wall-binding repeat-containing protein n=1 Tax=Thermococcus sp. SY098 TaxID=3111325 RepID=UPI002D79EB00|nr:hypothetical protein [Thermococcus sp. SY098]WRS53195.1 hypothetical protein VFC49_03480 [Thermococcus sp. SY098]
MMRKKVLTTSLVMIFMLSLIPISHAADVNIVILVSDNEADSTLADSVANIINAYAVIKVPWGIYNPNYSAEVLKYAPDKVIIIGGPTAVPIDYEKDLEEMDIPFERWYGRNRYETNLVVVQKLKEEFPEEFSQIETVYIVHGRDVLSMLMQRWLDALPNVAEYKSIWVFTGEGYENLSLQILDEILEASQRRPWVEVIVTSRWIQLEHKKVPKPLFNINTDEIANFLRKKGYEVTVGNYTRGTYFTIKYAGTVGQVVLETLKLVDNKTQVAENFLDGLDIPEAKKRLNMAKEQITKAWKLYSLGNYQEAYLLAVAANRNADFVISMSAKEWNKIAQMSLNYALNREVLRLEARINALKILGINTESVEEVLAEIKLAIKSKNYSKALKLIKEAKEELREMFINEKRRLPQVPPDHREERGRHAENPRP